MGKVVLHVLPLSVEYCREEPTGQLVEGAAITPPLNTQPVQALWLLTTAGGAAAVKLGQQGVGSCVMLMVAVAVQPLAPVTVTV